MVNEGTKGFSALYPSFRPKIFDGIKIWYVYTTLIGIAAFIAKFLDIHSKNANIYSFNFLNQKNNLKPRDLLLNLLNNTDILIAWQNTNYYFQLKCLHKNRKIRYLKFMCIHAEFSVLPHLFPSFLPLAWDARKVFSLSGHLAQFLLSS